MELNGETASDPVLAPEDDMWAPTCLATELSCVAGGKELLRAKTVPPAASPNRCVVVGDTHFTLESSLYFPCGVKLSSIA